LASGIWVNERLAKELLAMDLKARGLAREFGVECFNF